MRVLYKFGAVWCVPCKQMDQLLEKYMHYDSMSDTYVLFRNKEDTVLYRKIDVDSNPEVVREFTPIRAVPTMVLIEDGVEIRRTSGVMKKDDLEKFIFD